MRLSKQEWLSAALATLGLILTQTGNRYIVALGVALLSPLGLILFLYVKEAYQKDRLDRERDGIRNNVAIWLTQVFYDDFCRKYNLCPLTLEKASKAENFVFGGSTVIVTVLIPLEIKSISTLHLATSLPDKLKERLSAYWTLNTASYVVERWTWEFSEHEQHFVLKMVITSP